MFYLDFLHPLVEHEAHQMTAWTSFLGWQTSDCNLNLGCQEAAPRGTGSAPDNMPQNIKYEDTTRPSCHSGENVTFYCYWKVSDIKVTDGSFIHDKIDSCLSQMVCW